MDTTPINSSSAGQRDTLISVSEVEEDKFAEKRNTNGLKAAWKWFIADPFSRWPFVLFILFGVLTILWLILYLTDSIEGYILAGIAAVIMAAYGANHFRILLGLKEQVDVFKKLNNEFRNENAQLVGEIDRLTKSKTELSSVADNIQLSNRKLKEGLKKFQELDKHLKSLSADSIEGLTKLQKSSEFVMDSWKKQLYQNERDVLATIMDHVETSDGAAGLSRDEWEEFMNQLPPAWKPVFVENGIEFDKYAGDDDVVDYKEFREVCDDIAKQKSLKY